MKVSLIVSMLCVFSFSVNAQTNHKKRLPSQASSERDLDSYESRPVKSDKSVELSIAYLNGKLKDPDDESTDSSGIGFRAGKTFNLADQFKTTTSFLVSRSKLDLEDLDGKVDTHITDVGLSQRFSYDIGTPSGATFRPFLEGGIGKGEFKAEGEFDNVTAEASLDYTKYSAALGVQLIMENGVTPFLMYEVARIKYDNKMEVRAGSNSQDIELTGDDKGSNRSLQLGIGILF